MKTLNRSPVIFTICFIYIFISFPKLKMEGKTTCYGREKQTNPQSSFNGRWNPKKTNRYISSSKKFRWYDEQGRQLTAGGLLPYDDRGVWVIGEQKTRDGEIEWTDPGGKYKFEDCDIYTTISREFSEELYHSSSISRECILNIKKTNTPTYVNGHRGTPVYICYIVHTDELKKYQVKLDPDLFLRYRQKTLSGNPNVPPEYYSSVKLKHILFSEIGNVNLSYRLKRILRYGTLSNKLPSNISLSRSTSPDTEETSKESKKDTKCDEVKSITTPIPIKVSSSPVFYDFEKVFSLNVLGTSPPLLVGGDKLFNE